MEGAAAMPGASGCTMEAARSSVSMMIRIVVPQFSTA
jgi:hypothetical protein